MSQQSDGLCLDLKLDWSWKAHCEDFGAALLISINYCHPCHSSMINQWIFSSFTGIYSKNQSNVYYSYVSKSSVLDH